MVRADGGGGGGGPWHVTLERLRIANDVRVQSTE